MSAATNSSPANPRLTGSPTRSPVSLVRKQRPLFEVPKQRLQLPNRHRPQLGTRRAALHEATRTRVTASWLQTSPTTAIMIAHESIPRPRLRHFQFLREFCHDSPRVPVVR